MKKYVVLYCRKTDDDRYESDVEGIFDTEEEANQRAMDVFEEMSPEDRDDCSVEVGEISEEDLDYKGEWETFTKVDILWTLDESDFPKIN